MTHKVSIDSFDHVIIDNQLVCKLTHTELTIFSTIMRSNFVVSRDLLLSTVYMYGDEPDLKIFDIYKAKIIKKLGPNYRDIIQTVWGRGWRRGENYEFVEAEPQVIAIPIAAKLIEDLHLFHPKKSLTEIVDKILRDRLKALINGA